MLGPEKPFFMVSVADSLVLWQHFIHASLSAIIVCLVLWFHIRVVGESVIFSALEGWNSIMSIFVTWHLVQCQGEKL